MKRKKVRQPLSSYYVPVVAVVIGSVTLIAVVNTMAVGFLGNNVLGIATYFAKGSDSSGSGGGSGSSDSGDSSKSDTSGSSGSNSGSSGSSESKSDSSKDSSESSGSSTPTSRGSLVVPTKTEMRTEAGVRTQTEIKPDDARTEIRLSETERIRTRVKDGETRIDITSGGVKTRLEYKDDRVVIKAEREDGTEIELEEDTIFKIDERLSASGIKVATAGADRFVIQRGNAGAVTSFPLSIDLATNSLIVNTPSGQKTVTVLPDQAVQNLLVANVVNRIGGQAVVDAVRDNRLSSVRDVVTLGIRDNIAVYEINGISDQRLLGFIPVAIQKSVIVSAETGDVVTVQESLVNQVFDILSF